uniref:(California timema) hypothetical protein n=1 Tax=Timema californicum TaxID=61474 RepID=A0A7R9IX81_TIMCA|nr:unnamed protein product [Timema californicum]
MLSSTAEDGEIEVRISVSRDLEEMSGSDIPGYTQRLVCCGQGTSHSPALLPHTDYQRYKDLVVDKGGQPNRGRTTKKCPLHILSRTLLSGLYHREHHALRKGVFGCSCACGYDPQPRGFDS